MVRELIQMKVAQGDEKSVNWFRAYAYLNGFGEAIQETRDPELPRSYFLSIDTSTDEGKKAIPCKEKE
jgi:hypothetical protein